MSDSIEFLKSVLNTITDQIVVIDKNGDIKFVNHSWTEFGRDNDCQIKTEWIGINYLNGYDNTSGADADFGVTAVNGIRAVIIGQQPDFYLEYACHSPDEKRFFMMQVTPFIHQEVQFFVISHKNITNRKLAEEKVLHLSQIDGLTGIANRRYFDETLENEWKRCARSKQPLTLAMIDVDHFKLLNDTYGHQAGDNSLVMIGNLLKDLAQRPADLCCRYGGEEFAIIMPQTSNAQAVHIASKLITLIAALNIPNKKSPTKAILTVSIGLATVLPSQENDTRSLIAKADKSLYRAKKKGRNRVESNL
ncbi:diguanylate cyclase [Psychromonas ingrahamii 37]|uniref:diguanylate cyclase n=1 Tax=Psychromonas ingrahamii (strain DSM 17664 / CCUG 51855 / 37) TaxID=357804 RepID=A1STZ3_PSYIN|nr:sensor domain-containing diguanylate cyclase [Psychromonas ingrahamii]ABM02958.1 diguanylate cyclase [Psychromonas ingrahamii 37]